MKTKKIYITITNLLILKMMMRVQKANTIQNQMVEVKITYAKIIYKIKIIILHNKLRIKIII